MSGRQSGTHHGRRNPGVVRLGRILLAMAGVMLLPLLALAGETTVMLNGGIAATLNIPQTEKPAPAVLMLHGFGSSRDEVGLLFQRQAEALAARGIGSLRIDFRGFGKSDGDTGATTIDSQIDDAKVGLAYLSKVKGIDTARVGVLGFSLGGGIAMLASADEPQKIKSLATWSSVGDLKADFLTLLGQKAFDRAKEDGVVGLDFGWRTIVLKQAFFDSLDAHKLDDAIAKYPGAYLAIAGTKDAYAAYVAKFTGLSKSAMKSSYMVPDADHVFGANGEDQTKAIDVIFKTTEWFAKTL